VRVRRIIRLLVNTRTESGSLHVVISFPLNTTLCIPSVAYNPLELLYVGTWNSRKFEVLRLAFFVWYSGRQAGFVGAACAGRQAQSPYNDAMPMEFQQISSLSWGKNNRACLGGHQSHNFPVTDYLE